MFISLSRLSHVFQMYFIWKFSKYSKYILHEKNFNVYDMTQKYIYINYNYSKLGDLHIHHFVFIFHDSIV